MNRPLAFLAVLLAIVLSGCAELPQSDQDARKTATDWLDLLDAHAYKQAFAAQASRIKNGSKEEDFVRVLQARRTPFGRAKTREFLKVVPSRTMSGAPDGTYMTIFFRTKFEYKSTCYERVILTKEAGYWQVSGYRYQ